jgi:hypothetical protein
MRGVCRTLPVFLKALSMLAFVHPCVQAFLQRGEKLSMTDADIGRQKVVFNHFAARLLQRCEKTDIQLLKGCGVRETGEDSIAIHAELAELYIDVRDNMSIEYQS